MAMAGKYDVGVPKHKHLFRKQVARIAPDLQGSTELRRRDPLLRLPGRRRPAGDDARADRRLPRGAGRHPDPGHRLPPRGRARRRRRARATSRPAASSRSAPGSSSTPPGSGPTRSRTWSGAAEPSTSRPARASTSSCRATGSGPRPGFITKTEKSVLFVIPWGRHWIIGTTDTPGTSTRRTPRPAGPTSTTCSDTSTRSSASRSTTTTSRASAPGSDRWRAASPSPPPDLPRAHGRRARARPGDDRRWQAHDVPRDGAATPSTRRPHSLTSAGHPVVRDSITDRMPLVGAAGFEARTNQRALLARRAACTSRGSTTCSGGTAASSTRCSTSSASVPSWASRSRAPTTTSPRRSCTP